MTAFYLFASLILNAVFVLCFREFFYHRGFKAGYAKAEQDLSTWWKNADVSVEKVREEIRREE